MAWQDEWWKGRVIEAVNFDSRTATMGGLCPDLYADTHSGCGYPSGAQPDTYVNELTLTLTLTLALTLTLTLALTLTRYVNEEWFGLFAIAQPQCQAGGKPLP